MGFYEVWASLTPWQRRGAFIGLAGFLGSGLILVDVSMLRPQQYQEEWKEREDQKRARAVHSLFVPGQQSAGSRQALEQPLPNPESRHIDTSQKELPAVAGSLPVGETKTQPDMPSSTHGQQKRATWWFPWPRGSTESNKAGQ